MTAPCWRSATPSTRPLIHAPGSGTALPRIVLDRLHVLTGTPARPVQLADVEAVAHQAATDYRAPIRLDPWQAIGLAQRLRARGVAVTEWTFSPVSVGRLAMTLHRLFREHRLALPDDAELLDELATVRLRESTPGVYRLDHDASGHDDRAVAIGLAALALTERTEGRGSITVPRSAPVVRTMHRRPPGAALAARGAGRCREDAARAAGRGHSRRARAAHADEQRGLAEVSPQPGLASGGDHRPPHQERLPDRQ